MGDVIKFPTGEKENEYEQFNIFSLIVYKWWMEEFYPMFLEGGKLQHSYHVYGELILSLNELREMGLVHIHEEDDGVQLAMDERVGDLVYETVINAYNSASPDKLN